MHSIGEYPGEDSNLQKTPLLRRAHLPVLLPGLALVIALASCASSGPGSTKTKFNSNGQPEATTPEKSVQPQGFNEVSGQRRIYYDVVATPVGPVPCIVDTNGDAESLSCDWSKVTTTTTGG